MVKDNQLVSIIMPSYNHAHFLKRTIRSVIDQTYTNWELIIVDNHSGDNTDEVIASFNEPRIRLYKIHNNGIIARSRNMGINESRGEFIAFLDSDDWWCAGKLLQSIEVLLSGQDLIYHDMFLVEHENNLYNGKLSFRTLDHPVFASLLTEGNAIINSSVVVRARLLQATGLLDEQKDLIASEDYDLWIRISLVTDKFYKIQECLGFYWYGGANVSKNKNLSVAGNIILTKHKEKMPGNLAIKATGYINYTEGLYLMAMQDNKSARKFFFRCVWQAKPVIKMKALYRVLQSLV